MSVRPEDVGLSSERLARIDAHLKNRYLDPGKIAGASTLVYRRGEVAWLSPIGLMDRERGKPMAEELIVIFMTQFFPSQTFNFRDQLRAIIYPAIID